MADGVMTMRVARSLRQMSALQSCEILCGHGETTIDPPASLGKLKAWYGAHYANHAILADLDIAVVERATDRLIALIEIEETANKPKTLLGDALATLLASRITFQGKRHWDVGAWTALIILAKCTNPASHARIAYLDEQVRHLKAHLTTPNAAIGEVVMAGFEDEAELAEKLRTQIVRALTR